MDNFVGAFWVLVSKRTEKLSRSYFLSKKLCITTILIGDLDNTKLD